jgi:hypothetical protein
MTALGKFYTEKSKHRLHERINTLLIVTDSIGATSTLFRHGHVDLRPYGFAVFECIQFDMELTIGPYMGAPQAASKDTILDKIELEFLPKSQTPDPTSTSSFKKAILQSVGAFFGDFFEAYRDWLERNIDTNPTRWPSVWNFGRVIRNSCAHDGLIYFESEKATPVKWHNLEYGWSNNERRVLFNDMGVGDLIALMFEMSAELDKLNAPWI